MGYLVMKNDNMLKTYSITSTCDRPRLVMKDGVDTSYIPLTTASTNEHKIRISNSRLAEYITTTFTYHPAEEIFTTGTEYKTTISTTRTSYVTRASTSDQYAGSYVYTSIVPAGGGSHTVEEAYWEYYDYGVADIYVPVWDENYNDVGGYYTTQQTYKSRRAYSTREVNDYHDSYTTQKTSYYTHYYTRESTYDTRYLTAVTTTSTVYLTEYQPYETKTTGTTYFTRTSTYSTEYDTRVSTSLIETINTTTYDYTLFHTTTTTKESYHTRESTYSTRYLTRSSTSDIVYGASLLTTTFPLITGDYK